jgi:hypothetical protein
MLSLPLNTYIPILADFLRIYRPIYFFAALHSSHLPLVIASTFCAS